MDKINSIICSNIRAWRKAKSLKQPAVADAIGVPVKTYGAWEQKRNPVPVDIQQRICDYYGKKPVELTTEVDISNQPNNLADNAKIKQMVKEVCDQQYAELRGFVEGFLASGKLPDEVVSLARKIVDQHPISCENCGNIVGLSKPNKKTRNGRVL